MKKRGIIAAAAIATLGFLGFKSAISTHELEDVKGTITTVSAQVAAHAPSQSASAALDAMTREADERAALERSVLEGYALFNKAYAAAVDKRYGDAVQRVKDRDDLYKEVKGPLIELAKIMQDIRPYLTDADMASIMQLLGAAEALHIQAPPKEDVTPIPAPNLAGLSLEELRKLDAEIDEQTESVQVAYNQDSLHLLWDLWRDVGKFEDSARKGMEQIQKISIPNQIPPATQQRFIDALQRVEQMRQKVRSDYSDMM